MEYLEIEHTQCAARRYAMEVADHNLANELPTSLPYSHDVYEAFIAGVEWCKNNMKE